jgi:hypothetical protein
MGNGRVISSGATGQGVAVRFVVNEAKRSTLATASVPIRSAGTQRCMQNR